MPVLPLALLLGSEIDLGLESLVITLISPI